MNPPLLIAFELSNRCNYSHLHSKCPVKPDADPIFLNTDIIKDAVKFLGKIGYAGELYFSIYNEPLVDPRFFMLVEFTKKYCPDCRIQLFTNGWNLNQYMVDELLKIGIGMFMVSAYSDSEEKRLGAINYHVPSSSRPTPMLRIELDDRMNVYDLPANQWGPCWMPAIYPFINHLGQLALCCHDYEYRNVLADLHSVSFEDAMRSDFRELVCNGLKYGNRVFDVCNRCPRGHSLAKEEEALIQSEGKKWQK